MSLYFESKTTGIHNINDFRMFVDTLRKFDDMLIDPDDLFKLVRHVLSCDYMFRPCDCYAILEFTKVKLERINHQSLVGEPTMTPLDAIEGDLEHLRGYIGKHGRTNFYNIIANMLEKSEQHDNPGLSYEFCKKYYPDIVK